MFGITSKLPGNCQQLTNSQQRPCQGILACVPKLKSSSQKSEGRLGFHSHSEKEICTSLIGFEGILALATRLMLDVFWSWEVI